jgi:hypothetical protein
MCNNPYIISLKYIENDIRLNKIIKKRADQNENYNYLDEIVSSMYNDKNIKLMKYESLYENPDIKDEASLTFLEIIANKIEWYRYLLAFKLVDNVKIDKFYSDKIYFGYDIITPYLNYKIDGGYLMRKNDQINEIIPKIMSNKEIVFHRHYDGPVFVCTINNGIIVNTIIENNHNNEDLKLLSDGINTYALESYEALSTLIKTRRMKYRFEHRIADIYFNEFNKKKINLSHKRKKYIRYVLTSLLNEKKREMIHYIHKKYNIKIHEHLEKYITMNLTEFAEQRMKGEHDISTEENPEKYMRIKIGIPDKSYYHKIHILDIESICIDEINSQS